LTGDFNVNTGFDDTSKVGEIRKWNFVSETEFFKGKCARLFGSAGDLFAPGMKKEQFVSVFSPEMCRSVLMEFEAENKIHGINVFKYSGGDRTVDNGTLYPENECYCSGECVPSGLFNVSSCRFGTPIFMSFPHFFKADPFYLDQVDGMKPDKKKHQFSISFEPVSLR
jgi:scavenger receptor class B, member 1